MQKQFYFLAPVEVVRVTSQNLAEVAEWCGGSVHATESKKVPGRMDNYVWVPTPKGTHLSWAFPGMFVVKRLSATVKGGLRETWMVYRRDSFEATYYSEPINALEATWGRAEREKSGKKPKAPTSKETEPQPTQVTVNVFTDARDTTADIAKKAVERLQEAFPDLPIQEVANAKIEDLGHGVRRLTPQEPTVEHEVNTITENGVEGPITEIETNPAPAINIG